MDKLIPSDDKSPDGTGYNNPPAMFREITEQEFARSDFFSYPFVLMECRQVCRELDTIKWIGPKAKGTLSLKLFWMHDNTCVAISADFHTGTMRYFRGGCAHKYRELTSKEAGEMGLPHFGSCFHVVQCQACKYTHSYDSSG